MLKSRGCIPVICRNKLKQILGLLTALKQLNCLIQLMFNLLDETHPTQHKVVSVCVECAPRGISGR